MGTLLNRKQIIEQSESAYGQWKEKWREHAKKHSKLKQKSFSELQFSGIGKTIVLIANGASLERDLEIIKNNPGVHTMVCDKTLGHCLKAGIKPTYCIMADAVVNFETYCEPFKEQLQDTILLANICGNPKWAFDAEWKDIYFYVNKDVIKSEKEFIEISGCKNVVAAGSNVSNAMVILATQCDNKNSINFMGYDKILLTGYDYSWMPNKNYYAFDKEANGKTYYMNHMMVQDVWGRFAYTSHNLAFSAKWLYGYVTTFKLPIVQCSQQTIMPLPIMGKLENHIKYNYRCEDSETMVKLNKNKVYLLEQLQKIQQQENFIKKDHSLNMIKSV